MAQKKRRRLSGDLSEYILIILHKEGAQTLKQLQEKTTLRTVAFGGKSERRRRTEEVLGVEYACNSLITNKLVKVNEQSKYELTQEGKIKAEETAFNMERGAHMIETQFLSPSAAARNSTAGYVFVAAAKMIAGLFSGSVGLIADGADTTVDTAASAIVWAGIKFKKELWGTITILGLMFFTAALLFYESVRSIIENIAGTFVPMTLPFLVIAVELVAMVSMLIISVYQRFVGKRSQSLSLISQSIDSKNSMYSSAAVIVGAVFTLFGIYFVDAIVGAFIAVRITIDGADLTREVIRTMKGHKPELSKYKLPFEERIAQRRLDNFRNWILYAIHNDKIGTKEEIVCSLETTFRPSYMPAVFNEFTAGKDMDFSEDFQDLVKPLLDDSYLTFAEGKYCLTAKGKTYIKDTVDTMRFKETEL